MVLVFIWPDRNNSVPPQLSSRRRTMRWLRLYAWPRQRSSSGPYELLGPVVLQLPLQPNEKQEA